MQTLLRLQRSLEAAPWSCAVLAEWQERFGQDLALLKPHMTPTGEAQAADLAPAVAVA